MKKQNQLFWLIVVALMMFFTIAQAVDWVKLGSRTVKYTVDRDVIVVGVKEGTFTAIKLLVKRAGIHFMDMKVHFVNGDVQDVEIRKLIPKGGETRVIDLVGEDRRIEKVTFWYTTPSKKGKPAIVSLWGRH